MIYFANSLKTYKCLMKPETGDSQLALPNAV